MKISIITFGCSLNQSDSEVMRGILMADGYNVVSSSDDADLIIINTCTVKDQTIRNFEKQIKGFNDKKIIIAGCIAQTDDFDYSLIGTDQIDKISEVVRETLAGNIVKYTDREKLVRVNLSKIRKNKIIEIIPICQGCLGLPCSFCKTKEARGHLFSYSVESIVGRVKQCLSEGVKEIWLTAQDTGAYGKDIGSSLIELLKTILLIEGDYKIRLGMLNPNHLKYFIDELVEIYKDERMFKFIHIPIQSGNDEILAKMNREYSIDDFYKIVDKLSGITIATDIIVGFPGESEEQFNDTIKLVKKVRFDVVNISRYSARPKTIAAKMPQLNQKIIKDRSRKLTKIFREISLENNQKWLNWEGEILVDDKHQGRNFAYKPVVLDNGHELGIRVNVKIKEVTTFHLKASSLLIH